MLTFSKRATHTNRTPSPATETRHRRQLILPAGRPDDGALTAFETCELELLPKPELAMNQRAGPGRGAKLFAPKLRGILAALATAGDPSAKHRVPGGYRRLVCGTTNGSRMKQKTPAGIHGEGQERKHPFGKNHSR